MLCQWPKIFCCKKSNVAFVDVDRKYKLAYFQRIHNMSQPDWITDEVFAKLWKLREFEFGLYVYTKEMTAIKSGKSYKHLCLQNYFLIVNVIKSN